MSWDTAWRTLAALGLIVIIWAGVVGLAIVAALHEGYQGETPTREDTDDEAAP